MLRATIYRLDSPWGSALEVSVTLSLRECCELTIVTPVLLLRRPRSYKKQIQKTNKQK